MSPDSQEWRPQNQTAGDRLVKLAQSEAYLFAAERGTIPVEAVRNWVLNGNSTLKDALQ